MTTGAAAKVVQIHALKEFSFDDGVIIDGFPSVGLVSTIAANYLVNQLKLDLVATIHSPLMPVAAVIRDGHPLEPIRVYHRKQLLVFLSEFRPPAALVDPLVEAILAWEPVSRARLFLTLEGLPGTDPEPGSEPGILAVGATAATKEYIRKMGWQEMTHGLITGISGVLLNIGFARQLDVLCLMAEAHEAFPDARSAARLIEAVDRLLPEVEIDTGPLLKEADRMEKQIRTAVAQVKGIARFDPSADPTQYLYR